MIKITKIKTEIYFDDQERAKFYAWRVSERLTLGEIAYKLDISHTYLTAILQGQRNLTRKLLSKFKDIGYCIEVLPNDKNKEEN